VIVLLYHHLNGHSNASLSFTLPIILLDVNLKGISIYFIPFSPVRQGEISNFIFALSGNFNCSIGSHFLIMYGHMLTIALLVWYNWYENYVLFFICYTWIHGLWN
jgi:hypothetical protein